MNPHAAFLFPASSGTHRVPSFPSFPSVQIPQQTLLARATWLALPATRAVAKRKQQKKGK
jgi:hypothetical protein